jgi:hypothetical protein
VFISRSAAKVLNDQYGTQGREIKMIITLNCELKGSILVGGGGFKEYV